MINEIWDFYLKNTIYHIIMGLSNSKILKTLDNK